MGGESDQLKAIHLERHDHQYDPGDPEPLRGGRTACPAGSIASRRMAQVTASSGRRGSSAATPTTPASPASSTPSTRPISRPNSGTATRTSARDDFGNFAKNPAPVVANGKVYCPTFSNKLVVYGLLSPISNGIYEMTARCSGKALDAAGHGTANGTNVDQFTYNGGANQKWSVTNVGRQPDPGHGHGERAGARCLGCFHGRRRQRPALGLRLRGEPALDAHPARQRLLHAARGAQRQGPRRRRRRHGRWRQRPAVHLQQYLRPVLELHPGAGPERHLQDRLPAAVGGWWMSRGSARPMAPMSINGPT